MTSKLHSLPFYDKLVPNDLQTKSEVNFTLQTRALLPWKIECEPKKEELLTLLHQKNLATSHPSIDTAKTMAVTFLVILYVCFLATFVIFRVCMPRWINGVLTVWAITLTALDWAAYYFKRASD